MRLDSPGVAPWPNSACGSPSSTSPCSASGSAGTRRRSSCPDAQPSPTRWTLAAIAPGDRCAARQVPGRGQSGVRRRRSPARRRRRARADPAGRRAVAVPPRVSSRRAAVARSLRRGGRGSGHGRHRDVHRHGAPAQPRHRRSITSSTRRTARWRARDDRGCATRSRPRSPVRGSPSSTASASSRSATSPS